MPKKQKIKILSYTYKRGRKTFTAEISGPVKPGSITTKSKCQCGDEKCKDGKVWKCLPLDDEGTCIWFITNENC